LEPFKDDFYFKKDYSNETNLNPQKRHEKIIEFLKKIKQKNQMTNQWQMDFPEEVVEVPAKIFKSIDINFGNKVN
jgi:hypothetical protein